MPADVITPPVTASPAPSPAVSRGAAPPRARAPSGRCCSRCRARPGTRTPTAATTGRPGKSKTNSKKNAPTPSAAREREHHAAQDQQDRQDDRSQQHGQHDEHDQQHDRHDHARVAGADSRRSRSSAVGPPISTLLPRLLGDLAQVGYLVERLVESRGRPAAVKSKRARPSRPVRAPPPPAAAQAPPHVAGHVRVRHQHGVGHVRSGKARATRSWPRVELTSSLNELPVVRSVLNQTRPSDITIRRSVVPIEPGAAPSPRARRCGATRRASRLRPRCRGAG